MNFVSSSTGITTRTKIDARGFSITKVASGGLVHSAGRYFANGQFNKLHADLPY
jgi:hypothetical protein